MIKNLLPVLCLVQWRNFKFRASSESSYRMMVLHHSNDLPNDLDLDLHLDLNLNLDLDF